MHYVKIWITVFKNSEFQINAFKKSALAVLLLRIRAYFIKVNIPKIMSNWSNLPPKEERIMVTKYIVFRKKRIYTPNQLKILVFFIRRDDHLCGKFARFVVFVEHGVIKENWKRGN